MRIRAPHLLCLSLVLAAISALAQEGHPLTGTWAGDWGRPGDRMHLTLVMEWDGANITGTINPGPDAVPLSNVSLDVTTWTVRLEAEAKDQSGTPVRIVAEGRIENIGSWHRTLAGSWTQGGVAGDFFLTRK